jgi:hypothetical protein
LPSGVILGLDPRISISVHRAELSRIPGATDARVKPEHDAERTIPTHAKAYPEAYADEPDHDGFGTAQVAGQGRWCYSFLRVLRVFVVKKPFRFTTRKMPTVAVLASPPIFSVVVVA